MRVSASATSLSWIPSEAVQGVMKAGFSSGLSHYDPPPPGELGDLDELRRDDRFRFANRLEVWAEFDAQGRVTEHGRTGGVVMGSTTVRVAGVGVTFAAVPMPDLCPEPETGHGWIRFAQTCGGRTAVPLPWPVAGPPFVRLRAPLVWTTLAITLRDDGRTELALPGASPFPRHWVYGSDDTLQLKAGVADWQAWVGQPSWRRTPWGQEDSPVMVTAAETALERRLSTLIMQGERRPVIRELGQGEQLTAEGSPDTALYLLLDGVLDVSVAGASVAQVGPGAILGERSILEGGRRTATLTAVTPAKVASASRDVVDLVALEELAQGHRREEQPAGSAADPHR
jgi:hypothetical protein